MVKLVVRISSRGAGVERRGAIGALRFIPIALYHRTAGIQLGNKPFFAVNEVPAAAAHLFPYPPPKGVVAVGGDRGTAVVPDFAEAVFEIVDVGGGLPVDRPGGETSVGVVSQGDVAVTLQGVGRIVLPRARQGSIGESVPGRIVGPPFVRQAGSRRVVHFDKAVPHIVAITIFPVLGGLAHDVPGQVVFVAVVEHGVPGRVAGVDALRALQEVVFDGAPGSARVGDLCRGIPRVAVPDDGALARQVDLRQPVGGIPGVVDGDAGGIGKAFPFAVPVPGIRQTGVEGAEVYGLGELPSKGVIGIGCRGLAVVVSSKISGCIVAECNGLRRRRRSSTVKVLDANKPVGSIVLVFKMWVSYISTGVLYLYSERSLLCLKACLTTFISISSCCCLLSGIQYVHSPSSWISV